MFDTWHYKLGHPSIKAVKHVLNGNKINFECIPEPYICKHCQIGKSHKLPFFDFETVYYKPFELIAADLWGPSPVTLDQGHMYYISFVDAVTRHTWIYFLKNKSKTSQKHVV